MTDLVEVMARAGRLAHQADIIKPPSRGAGFRAWEVAVTAALQALNDAGYVIMTPEEARQLKELTDEARQFVSEFGPMIAAAEQDQ